MINATDEHGLVAAAMKAAGDVGYDWDLASGRIRWIGDVEGLLGPDHAEFGEGERFERRIDPDDLQGRAECLAEHYRTRRAFDCEYRILRHDGGFRWVHDRGVAEFDSAGKAVRLRGVLRPMDRGPRQDAGLERLAYFDELTGHCNRTRLRQILGEVIEESGRLGRPGAYLSIGIDNLCPINEAYGCLTADAVIVAVGRRLQRVVTPQDAIGRVGGDVYGLILRHCPQNDVGATAERILKLFRDHPVETPNGPLHVTVSVGALAFPCPIGTAHEAMTLAETALQAAKRQGRDCFSLYLCDEGQRQDQRRSIAVGEQIKQALSENRLAFAYQPIVDAASGRVAFHECLLRMRTPEGEIVSAGKFVPVIERLGLSRIIDRRVLELVVDELETHPDVRLALNISGFTASDGVWLSRVERLLAGRPDVAARLIVEITETAAIQDLEETARFVTRLRDLGCRVALDDFGAGFTSFRHLKGLVVDVVKIDGSFVQGIGKSMENRLFVRTVVGLARSFGFKTVAECVETAEDAAALVEEGIDFFQGHHFARPSLERPWLMRLDGAERMAAAAGRGS